MAPPSTSSLEKIKDQLIVELKKIKTANGYRTNILDIAITTRPTKWQTFNVFPCVLVLLENGSHQLVKPKGRRTSRNIKLCFRLDTRTTDAITQISKLETDLEYLLNENIRLNDGTNNLCVQIKLQSDRTSQGVFDPVELWMVTLEVVYHEQY